MEKKHCKLRITGKVQGVWYRASSRDKAAELGLAGFVRNDPDGSVYAEVEGPPAAVDRFIDWAKNGPPRAEVEEVEVREDRPAGFDTFEVRR